MADDKHYVPGSYYMIDDLTGRKIRSYRAKRMWTGTMRAEPGWNPRQPQDLVRGVPDNQTVAIPRPRSTNVFVGPIETTTTANVAILSNRIPLSSTAGMAYGDAVGIMLDNGVIFFVPLAGVTASYVVLAQGLPYPAASGNVFYDYGPNELPVPVEPGIDLLTEFGFPITTETGQAITVS